jgi:hypothetical protein
MPLPLDALAALTRFDEDAFVGDQRASYRDALYGLLRREQVIFVAGLQSPRTEVSRILDLAQASCGDVVGVLVGRPDTLLNTARDGEWSLRDVLRHAMAVEVRYAAQVEYSSTRSSSDPIQIPPSRLPSDRLSPPEPEFAASRTGGVLELLQLIEKARAGSDTRLAKVPDSALTRPSMWGTQLLDVRLRLHQIAVHLTETAIQIEKIVGSGGELRAILRRCCTARGMHERWSLTMDRTALDDSYRTLADDLS